VTVQARFVAARPVTAGRGSWLVCVTSAERTAIMPFAEPGACRLQLQTP
jgi:hypothetical protein